MVVSVRAHFSKIVKLEVHNMYSDENGVYDEDGSLVITFSNIYTFPIGYFEKLLEEAV